jgi:hypothetical protein
MTDEFVARRLADVIICAWILLVLVSILRKSGLF